MNRFRSVAVVTFRLTRERSPVRSRRNQFVVCFDDLLHFEKMFKKIKLLILVVFGCCGSHGRWTRQIITFGFNA